MKKLLEKLNEVFARVDQVICIAGAFGDVDSMADSLRELLCEDDDVLIKCFGDLPEWLIEALDNRDETAEAFYQWVIETGHLGFAIQMATPVMTWHNDSASFSWGYYSTRWVYADTFDAAVDAGLSWVQDCRRKEKSTVAQ